VTNGGKKLLVKRPERKRKAKGGWRRSQDAGWNGMTRARVTEWMTGGGVGEEVTTSWKSNRC
jgi:hypothetical protein